MMLADAKMNLIRTCFVLFFLYILSGCYVEGFVESPLAGKSTQCNNEGEPVKPSVDGTNCYKCICKNGFVYCRQEPLLCPSIEDCYLIMPKSDCCARCKGCWFNGTEHASHTEWSDAGRLLRCEAGIITVSRAECYVPCADSFKTRHTHYNCPVCNDCLINGQRVMEGRDVTIPEDPCLKCRCSRGGLTCAKRACSVLACPVSTQYTPPGECCPRCKHATMDKILPSLITNKPCVMGKNFHAHQSEFTLDSCTTCICLNGTSVCERKTCPVVTCSPDVLMPPLPGKCCPTCPIVEEVKTSCVVGGTTYQDGQSWRLDECKSCECHAGEPRCALERCPPIVCGFDQQLKKVPGQCCGKCVDMDGVCTVFGDPHYKTFDGKFYSFQGSCKYQLTGDCTNGTFTIRIANDARGSSRSSWTRTVSLRTKDRKITLGKKLRVKVDGSRVVLPYESTDGHAKITKVNNTVLASVSQGIQMLWDGEGFLEVTVSSVYRGHLCGLCGNFNSFARDDLKNRNGKVSMDVWKFGSSWRVGGRKACTREKERPQKIRCKDGKVKKARFLCRPFDKSDAFSACAAKLNPHNYRQACIRDACECPSGRCHCESYVAYVRECERLGVHVHDEWRTAAWCGAAQPPDRISRIGEGRSSKEEDLFSSGGSTISVISPRVPPAERVRPPPPIRL